MKKSEKQSKFFYMLYIVGNLVSSQPELAKIMIGYFTNVTKALPSNED